MGFNRKKSWLKKGLALMTSLTLLMGTIGCGGQTEETTSSKAPEETKKEESGQETAASSGNAFEELSLEGVELTIWAPIYWVGKTMTYDDNEAWQKVQEETGVKLTFIHPPAGEETEQFNLMIASDSLPDIICTGWGGDGLFIGGRDKYVEDEIIIPLDDLIDTYAPDYKEAIEKVVVKEQQKDFYTDNGSLTAFYAISPYEEWCYNGILIRQDWMEELGLERPYTMEQYENVLTQFKEKKGAQSPLILPKSGIDGNSGVFMTAWEIGPGFYQENGTVKYGPIQTEFKEYLKLMNDWYEKGLIDKDFSTRDDDAMKRMMTTGVSGMIIHSPDTVGSWMNGVSPIMTGGYPVLKEGERVNYRLTNYQVRPQFSYSITTACKNPEAAVKFLNYGYTKEGNMLYNYGIEGETYNLTGETVTYNGIEYPLVEYTDKMLNNPDYPVLDAILTFKTHMGPFIRFEHEGNPALDMQNAEIRKALTEEADTGLNIPMTTLNAEEGKEYARIMNQIQTYQDTAVLQFIMGTKSLDEFDSYVSDMKKLEIETAISFQQAALDRYNNR